MEKLKIPISESQTFLLKTIIGVKSEVAENYRKWVSSVNIDNNIDGESYSLIPALYKRLEEIDFKDINIPKYMGIYKKSLYKNGLLLGLLQQVCKDFNSMSIPFVLLEGIPLIINYHNDFGIRSISAIDITIDRKHFQTAIKILNKNGFFCDCGFDIMKNIEICHSYSFTNDKGMEIDLYWTVLPISLINVPINEPSKFLYNKVQCSMLCPEDFILQDCLHGAFVDPVFHLRWAFDLHTILKSEPKINWDILLGKLKNTSLPYTFFVMFEFFNEISSIKIPEWVLVKLFELGNNKTCIKNTRKRFIKPKTIFGKLGWYEYNLRFRDKGIIFRIIRFPKYILMTSKYNSYRDLLSAFFKKYMLTKGD